jgi:hypothetical protein
MNFDYLRYIPDSIFPWDLKILISNNNLPYSKNKHKTYEIAEDKDLSTPFVCSLTTENKELEKFFLERISSLSPTNNSNAEEKNEHNQLFLTGTCIGFLDLQYLRLKFQKIEKEYTQFNEHPLFKTRAVKELESYNAVKIKDIDLDESYMESEFVAFYLLENTSFKAKQKKEVLTRYSYKYDYWGGKYINPQERLKEMATVAKIEDCVWSEGCLTGDKLFTWLESDTLSSTFYMD